MILPTLRLAVLVSALAGTACGSTDPYVFRPNEFDRSDPGFNRPPANQDSVTVCFNGIGTSDGRVARLAEEECGRFGRRAQPAGESFGVCPLLVPIAARFACLPTTAPPPDTPPDNPPPDDPPPDPPSATAPPDEPAVR